tara:strand:- start:1365 stop:3026 length:1662 start_codon:yes stop_codon:yes gene_type:complete
MPAVFSPGEAETRPVDPDAIVYTTGDKVGELLGIAPGEPVLAAADSSASGFYISGTDLREHGFESGDSIFVFSDLYPLGETFTIGTPVVEDVSGTKYVKLPVTLDSGAAGTNDAFASYTTVANTEIQNKTIFTNGKKRGVTKDIVNKHIRRIQDRIDNYTHNAWRPYLVSAEYLNFDTYKPYRRRYYTDYVGTVPLLFRNVQQILRLEIWQGEDYRELAGAEARLEVLDAKGLSNGGIFLCPGAKGWAQLNEGSGSQQWESVFNEINTAQNIADLINKEDRTGRGTVTFTQSADSPGGTTYTQPGVAGDVSVFVHNEFLATANSDYGNGKIKITSMQQSKGGENATIATNNVKMLSISQTNGITKSGTLDLTGGDGNYSITFADSSDFADYGIVMVPNNSGDELGIIGYTANSGTVLQNGRLLHGTLPGSVTKDITQHRLQLDLQGGSSSGDQARLRDWWLDHEMGIIYFNNSYPFFEWNAVKVSYIYGERYLEKAIEEAATKLVASELLMSDDRSVLIPEGTQNIDLGSKAQLFRREAMDILARYKEVVVFA